MTNDELIKQVRKKYPHKLIQTGLMDTDDKTCIPLSLIPEILAMAKKKPKKEAPKYFKEFFVAYGAWYSEQEWNTQHIQPQVNSNPSERNALWAIMKQIEELHSQKGTPEDYTPERATALFTALLQAAARHRFLKDKISLHLVAKFFNDLVADAMKAANFDNPESGFNTFEHEEQGKQSV